MASCKTPEQLKAEGNEHFSSGDNEAALACYLEALILLDAAAASPAAATLRPVLLSNASAAAARLGRAAEARRHADRCVAARPGWPKGYTRQAAAALLQHRPGDAERALRAGLAACQDTAALRHELDRLLRVRAVRAVQCSRHGRPCRSCDASANAAGTRHSPAPWAAAARPPSCNQAQPTVPACLLPACLCACVALQEDDGDQSGLPGILPGTPGQRMRDLQADFGAQLQPEAAIAALPNDALRAAFMGDADRFK